MLYWFELGDLGVEALLGLVFRWWDETGVSQPPLLRLIYHTVDL